MVEARKIATHQPVRHSSVPPLRAPGAKWAADPATKAQLLADAAQAKNQGIPPYTTPNTMDDKDSFPEWDAKFKAKRKWTRKIIKELKTDTATAEDGIPVVVLKNCEDILSMWIISLAYDCWNQGLWPWKIHWLAPRHKPALPH